MFSTNNKIYKCYSKNKGADNMIVKVEKLVKRYKEKIALDHFNLQVEENDILGLIGPNGCGKTTAINCILSLLNYDKGEIEVFGKKMSPDAYDIKRKIGVVPQELALINELTVIENIDYFCSLYISDKALRKKYVKEAIDFVRLNEYENFRPFQLSGGLKRRLNIACGISHKPELLILDEPTVAVDAQSRNFILEGIKELNRNKTTIIYTTHYLEEAEMLCNKIVIMDNGRNVVSGTSMQLKEMINIKEKIYIDFQEITKDQIKKIYEIPHVTNVENNDEGIVIYFEKGINNLSNLILFIENNNLTYTSLYSEKPTLNDVFLELTGKELRD